MKLLVIIDILEESSARSRAWELLSKREDSKKISLSENFQLKRILETIKKKTKSIEYDIIDYYTDDFWHELGVRMEILPQWNGRIRIKESFRIFKKLFDKYDHIFCTSKKTQSFLDFFTQYSDVTIHKLPNEYYSREYYFEEKTCDKLISVTKLNIKRQTIIDSIPRSYSTK